MKEEIDAAIKFLSRVFLNHDKIAKEKVEEFNSNLAELLQSRFRNHWHESFPTKGQAYRCIRICPEEPLDPLLEKVCNNVGVCVSQFNLPMELTLWVDPKEVVCKFGDLKCSYHVVAKKDQNSGTMNNQTDNMDIEDLVEGAQELYQKKQSLTTHPVNSSEIHIPGYCADGTSNRFSTALRINGTIHYNMYGTSSGSSYDGSPRGKGKSVHSPHHKRSGNSGGVSNSYHYYNKTNGNGGFKASGIANGHSGMNGSGGGGFHRNHHHNHHHHHHHPHHHHTNQGGGSSPYQNGYLNGYHEDTTPNGFSGYPEQRSISPSKMNGVGNGNAPPTSNGMPPIVPMSQGSPTPEQIQQQMQHPPPMPPPPIPPPHLHQAFNQPPPPTDPTSLSLPPPPTCSQQTQQQQSQSISTSTFANPGATTSSSISIPNTNVMSNGSGVNINSGNNNSSSISTCNSNSNSHSGGKINNHGNHSNGKYQSNRGGSGVSRGNNNRQTSPIKDVK